jgi:DNA-directed RNA polymerase specialized sigma24 family protein
LFFPPKRELVCKLFRHQGLAAHHDSRLVHNTARTPTLDSPDRADAPDGLEAWSIFHQEITNVPAEEREVVGLIFYHGWTQVQVADLFRVHVRTVRRRWGSVLLKLRRAMKRQDY